MREYSNIISLTTNERGIYCIDPSMGCHSGMSYNTDGCYNDCYAAKSAKRYGYDFSKTVLRYFQSERHKRQIILKIGKLKLPFVRMGCSGDPSENWEHTLSICKTISSCNKEIVIITRHWNLLTDAQLNYLSNLNICINTSISALDDPILIINSLAQYNRIKPYCKSVLRIISCDFNLNNAIGKRLAEIQHNFFKNDSILDTVFRPGKSNKLVTEGVINVKESKFLGSKCLVSKFNKKTYFGKCSLCPQMCGVNINEGGYKYENRKGIITQMSLYDKKTYT